MKIYASVILFLTIGEFTPTFNVKEKNQRKWTVMKDYKLTINETSLMLDYVLENILFLMFLPIFTHQTFIQLKQIHWVFSKKALDFNSEEKKKVFKEN